MTDLSTLAASLSEAVDILDQYATFVREWVKSDDLGMHPYLPMIEQVRDSLRAHLERNG